MGAFARTRSYVFFVGLGGGRRANRLHERALDFRALRRPLDDGASAVAARHRLCGRRLDVFDLFRVRDAHILHSRPHGRPLR